MGFWDSMTEGMNAGVKLGVRATERAEDREQREKERKEDKEERAGVRTEEKRRWEAENKRSETKFTWESSDRQKKEQYEKAEKSFKAANALYEAGETTGDESQKRMAAKILADTYNQHWVNGDEMKIIFKSDSASNPKLAEKWNTDENLKDKDVAILSKSGGVMPFKNLKDVFKFAAGNLNMDNFLTGVKQAELKVAELNAKEEPFTGEDGHKYVKTWELGPGGIPRKGAVRAYTDVVKESKGQEKLREAETILGKRPSQEEKRVLAGVSKAESPSERIAARKGLTGEGLKVAKEQRELFKKDLDLVLKPFVTKGKPVLDPETGEMTEAGENGMKEAGKLIDRYKEDSESLSTEDKRKVPHAIRAWEIYNKISSAVTSNYVKPAAGNWKQYDTAPAKPKEKNREAERGF